jgi:hypothetical protein
MTPSRSFGRDQQMLRHRAARILATTGITVAVIGGLAPTSMAATSHLPDSAARNSTLGPSSAVTAGGAFSSQAAVSDWQNVKPISLRDRCGGVNGWVQWSNVPNGWAPPSSLLQVYGEIWTNPASCGGAGVHYFKVTWDDPFAGSWSSASHGQVAGPGQTVGFNSGVIVTGSIFTIGNIVGYLCSTEGTGNCNSSHKF